MFLKQEQSYLIRIFHLYFILCRFDASIYLSHLMIKYKFDIIQNKNQQQNHVSRNSRSQKQETNKSQKFNSDKYIYQKKKLKMSSQFRKLTPLLNRVLVQKYEPIKKTASGILLQDSQDKNVVGEIVEVGPGNLDNNGRVLPITVKVGDTVLLPDFGGQKVKLEDKEFYLFRDTDILGILHK
ncbi:hypothetical protein pb186bvf_002542 [Paramecium bursaria]